MISQAKVAANRENARKSTGPRTDAGKEKARLNAYKHGNRARTAPPVLPQEDPRELAGRIGEWIDSYRPRNPMERDLVEQAAKLSWDVDRAGRVEAAELSRRVADAEERAAARRMDEVEELGRQLFSLGFAGDKILLRTLEGRSPGAIVRRLEATTEGCRWLLARWAEFDNVLRRAVPWDHARLLRFIRLQGKQAVEAMNDPALCAILLACDVLSPGLGEKFWERCRGMASHVEHGFVTSLAWQAVATRPGDKQHAAGLLNNVVAREVAAIYDRLRRHDRAAPIAHADCAAARDGKDLEGLRRLRSVRHRELMRTLEMLMKLRKLELPGSLEEPQMTGPVVDDDATSEVERPEEHAASTITTATNEATGPVSESVDEKRVAATASEGSGDERSQHAGGNGAVDTAEHSTGITKEPPIFAHPTSNPAPPHRVDPNARAGVGYPPPTCPSAA